MHQSFICAFLLTCQYFSKPGASPVAVWVSHRVIGLNRNGYGALLGEGVFGCVKVRQLDLLITLNTSH